MKPGDEHWTRLQLLLKAEGDYLRAAGWQSEDGRLWSGGLIRTQFRVVNQTEAVAMQRRKDRADLRSMGFEVPA